MFALHRHEPNRRCQVGASIAPILEGVRGEVDLAIEQVLAGITIDDVVVRLKPHVRRSGIRRDKARVG